jgi:bifunctional non-homologous end joining protein LigD
MPKATKSQNRKADTERAASPSDRLATYEAKRRFDVTPEPRSSQAGAPLEKKAAALAFVVQKHDARRLHYDFRLEVDGAMVSWAVPKGPSYDPSVRRLAVQTEDHPMEYNAFEGRIPDGQYGAGDVLIWDQGSYETVPPGAQHAMLAKGHLHVRLFGEKLVGEWHVVRTNRSGAADDGAGGSGKAQWLLFKAKDTHANAAYDVIAERPESVVSGRAATRGPRRVGASEQGLSAQSLLQAVGEPALAIAERPIGDGSEYVFEVKYDGYRLFASKAGAEVRLTTRHAHDWSARFGPIVAAVARLPARECVLDGEACIVDEHGHPSFAALQDWLAGGSRDARLAYAVFDLLWLDGRDLRPEPIETRQELLEGLLRGQGAPLTLSRALQGDMGALLQAAREGGLEGLIAKRKGSPYVAGRSGLWVKLRFDRRQECAIAGFVPLAGTEHEVGALLVSVVEAEKPGRLVYAGRVGTGFDARTRRELGRRLEQHPLAEPAIEAAPHVKTARWAVPELVCEVAFTEWTSEGSMRHPRFIGLREDKAPLECVRNGDAAPRPDARQDAPEGAPASPAARPAKPSPAAPPLAAPPAKVKLANPDKVLFPRDGITKREIWDYYTAIADVMLPHLAGRPLTLQRYPDGIEGEEWYQQNAPDKTPAFVRLIDTGPRHENKKRIACDNVETLQWLANLAALTLHSWVCHVPPGATTRAAIDHAMALPDYVVIDLDPGNGPWSHLVEVARALRTLLEALELESYVKTSGKRGVHVVVPIAPGPTHAQATRFAEQVARAVAKVLPDVASVERMKEKRGGKLYVDYGQNGEGRTIVCPYTIRARDGAVVSTPIGWDELDEALDPRVFTVRTVLERVRAQGDLYAGVLTCRQRLPPV